MNKEPEQLTFEEVSLWIRRSYYTAPQVPYPDISSGKRQRRPKSKSTQSKYSAASDKEFQTSSSDKYCFRLAQVLTPEAWNELVDANAQDKEDKKPASQMRLFSRVYMKEAELTHSKWYQTFYIAKLVKEVFASPNGVLSDGAVVYENAMKCASEWARQVELFLKVWPQESSNLSAPDKPPPWPKALEDELWQITRNTRNDSTFLDLLKFRTEEFNSVEFEALKKKGKQKTMKVKEGSNYKKVNVAPIIPTKPVSQKSLEEDLMIQVKNLGVKHWPRDSDVSFAIATQNVSEGRSWKQSIQQEAASLGSQSATAGTRRDSDRQRGKKRTGEDANMESHGQALAPVSPHQNLDSASAGPASPASSRPASAAISTPPRPQTMKEKQMYDLTQEYLDDENLKPYATFKCSPWEDFIKDIDRHSVDLAIVDGPWAVLPQSRYGGRDHGFTRDGARNLASGLNDVLEKDGSAVIYYGMTQAGMWQDALSENHFVIDAFMTVSMDPSLTNRKHLKEGTHIQAAHYVIVCHKRGGNPVRNINGKKAFVMRDSDYNCRANIINNYRSPLDKLRFPDRTIVRTEEKSKEIIKEWIYRYSNCGAVIFEPFAGTAVGGRVCRGMGRIWLGCEIENACFDVARKAVAVEMARFHLQATKVKEGSLHPWPHRDLLQHIGTAAAGVDELIDNRPPHLPEGETITSRSTEELEFDVEVKASKLPGVGNGLFAKRPFVKGERIVPYWGLVGTTATIMKRVADQMLRELGPLTATEEEEIRKEKEARDKKEDELLQRNVHLDTLFQYSGQQLDISILGSEFCCGTFINHAEGSRVNAKFVELQAGSEEQRKQMISLVDKIVQGKATIEEFMKLSWLLEIEAAEGIGEGEEFFLDYGGGYFRNRDLIVGLGDEDEEILYCNEEGPTSGAQR
mmetsp:Transcript_17937/g.47700  ORF Transcript_17937/g.47700 Transcript_17937/m.47700 type:complete len:913 (-) Transcript_17937:83-2821(-)